MSNFWKGMLSGTKSSASTINASSVVAGNNSIMGNLSGGGTNYPGSITTGGNTNISWGGIGTYTPCIPIPPMSDADHKRLSKTYDLYQKMQLLNDEERDMLDDIIGGWIADKTP